MKRDARARVEPPGAKLETNTQLKVGGMILGQKSDFPRKRRIYNTPYFSRKGGGKNLLKNSNCAWPTGKLFWSSNPIYVENLKAKIVILVFNAQFEFLKDFFHLLFWKKYPVL